MAIGIQTSVATDLAYQQCLNPSCRATLSVDQAVFACPECGDLLDVVYDWDRLEVPKRLSDFEAKWSRTVRPALLLGRVAVPRIAPVRARRRWSSRSARARRSSSRRQGRPVRGDGRRPIAAPVRGDEPLGQLQGQRHDRRLHARPHGGARRVACASTGNTSAALAVFCSATSFGFKAIIFIGSGKIAYGKLAQALDHGALTIQIAGDFDDAMHRVKQIADRLGIYLMNSVNPFRLEGQKAIMYRVLEALNWEPPDWIVVPGGNLGNSSSFGKAFIELKHLGLIDRVPRLAVINAFGARTLSELVGSHGLSWLDGLPDEKVTSSYYARLDESGSKASTIASAIEINRPVNLKKCLRALDFCDGVVRQVSDQEIMDAKARVGTGGLGCEPASAASVAGAKKLREEGVIAPSDRVVCILTGHQLKDPTATVAYHSGDQDQFEKVLGSRGVKRAGFANRPVVVANDLDDIIRMIALNSDASE